MQTLSEQLHHSPKFLCGVEMVSIRGSMAETRAQKARTFANELTALEEVDWVSITDNAGGNPQMAPQALAKPILYAGKEVVIHLTCKDLNRNGLESEAWQLSSEGFHNVLALTGDYPVGGNGGTAKPVFDLDSVGLINLLASMNRGFQDRYVKTQFCIGAVVNNYKLKEGELFPQYAKLRKKVECGASFIINQVGYDARKAHELRLMMNQDGMEQIPLIGNVFVLNARAANYFHKGHIPGVVVTKELLDLCVNEGTSADEGRSFFLELAAKQVAIFRGLGYRGVYLGGVHTGEAVRAILEMERTFSPDDWKLFAREMKFSRAKEFFMFEEDPATGLADPARPAQKAPPVRPGFSYRLSAWTHDLAFTPGSPLAEMGAKACSRAKDPLQGPGPLRTLEHLSKNLLFQCKDCGDCSLPEIAFLCPESQCAKNQRNGPCGGTREGRCEVDGFGECIWARAYERLKSQEKEDTLLSHVPVIQDQGLRGTSSWANSWAGRDHAGKTKKPTTQ